MNHNLEKLRKTIQLYLQESFNIDLSNENFLDDEPENDVLDYGDESTEPDYENDAFIQDVVSGGYDVSISGKHLGHFENMDVALLNLKNEFNRSNFFPTIWFVSDHGNSWPIDLEGNEIKSDMNEISADLFRSATNISKERGQDKRTTNLGKNYFREFVGKNLLNGQIGEINYMRPQQGSFEQVQIIIQLPEGKQDIIYYDVIGDIWEVTNITRADARMLSLIAKKINPKTKYGQGGKYFNISDYGINENEEEENQKNQNSERNKQIAREILNHLGGTNKLITMTGAKNFVAIDSGVSFRIGNKSVNYVKIVLNSMDTFDMEFGMIRGTNYTVKNREEGMYDNMIKKAFEKNTGMYLTLFENNSIKGLIESQINSEEEFITKANIAANAQHEMNKMVYQNQTPGYNFDDNLFKSYERQFIDNTEDIYYQDFEKANQLVQGKIFELSKMEGEQYLEWYKEDQRDEFYS